MMAIVSAGVPLDDYVNRPEESYKWEVLYDATFKSKLGNTVYVLNVTSLDWLDLSKASGMAGTTWSHLVYVVVPDEIKYKNVSNIYLDYGDNSKPNNVGGPDAVFLADNFAKYSGMISISA
jgi:hypothetical protein